jgi:hypothetical protein
MLGVPFPTVRSPQLAHFSVIWLRATTGTYRYQQSTTALAPPYHLSRLQMVLMQTNRDSDLTMREMTMPVQRCGIQSFLGQSSPALSGMIQMACALLYRHALPPLQRLLRLWALLPCRCGGIAAALCRLRPLQEEMPEEQLSMLECGVGGCDALVPDTGCYL